MCRVSPGIFFFVPENNVNLQSILMGRGIGHTQFEAVYTQYYARFVIIARRYVRDVAVAEDIVIDGELCLVLGKPGEDRLGDKSAGLRRHLSP